MKNLFNFEAEPFELDMEFDEYEEELDSEFGEFDTELTEEEWQGEVNRRSTPAIDAVNVQTLKANVVKIANQEWVRWGRGSIKEGDQNIRRVLEDYWITGTGRRHSEPGWWSKHPWSAAFISWVMKKAGAGRAFRYSSAHAAYIKTAKDNRLANNNNPFKAYRITEIKPQLGDLVCRSRAGSGANYENIRPGHKTHCDIVTEVQTNHLATIGGNVRNSVSKTIVPIDASGFINKSGYFAVVRLSAPSRSRSIFNSSSINRESHEGCGGCSGHTVPNKQVKRIVDSLGLNLSGREMSDLLAGRKLSLEARSLAELGEVLIRAENLYRNRYGGEAPTVGELGSSSGGPCQGCKGVCFPISGLNCLCFGLLSVSYCRRFYNP